jgi:hypothetical protein
MWSEAATRWFYAVMVPGMVTAVRQLHHKPWSRGGSRKLQLTSRRVDPSPIFSLASRFLSMPQVLSIPQVSINQYGQE